MTNRYDGDLPICVKNGNKTINIRNRCDYRIVKKTIRALKDIDFSKQECDETYRKELEALAEEKGNEYLHDMLQKVDEKAAIEIHANNIRVLLPLACIENLLSTLPYN